jgi:Kelch motif/Galactose oxidase, central domain
VAPGPSSSIVQARAPGWSATGGMIEARTAFTATLLLDGKVLVAGGRPGPLGDGAATSSAELYDPGSGTWSATGSMRGAREGQIATRLQNGTVLVAAGYGPRPGSRFTELATAELYDPISGIWTPTGDMVSADRRTATLLLNGQALAVGGNLNPNEPELFDPDSGTWTATGSLTRLRREGSTATLMRDGKVLVTGGLGRVNDPASAELYDPSSGSWTATRNMKVRRTSATATVLADGRVLVVGGASYDRDPTPLATAELYDPISGSWTATGNMVTTRGGGYSVTVLPDGKVLLAGGFRSNGSRTLASAELYDPGTGTWTAASNLDTPRAGQTATLLPDGTVLVVGGVGGNGKSLASAELYDPGIGN